MSEHLNISGFCKIRNNNVFLNGNSVFFDTVGIQVNEFLKNSYRHFNINYPKFFKMDNLSKLGFLTAELLINLHPQVKSICPEQTGIVLSNSSSSLDTDFSFYDSIKDSANYFPSPSVFVYTLPNIMIGEICIRHKFTGENVFFVSEQFNPKLIFHQVQNLFTFSNMQCCIAGWVELFNNNYDSFLCLIEKVTDNEAENKNSIFDEVNLFNIYKK